MANDLRLLRSRVELIYVFLFTNMYIYSSLSKSFRRYFHYFTLLYQTYCFSNDRWMHRVFFYVDDVYQYYLNVIVSSKTQKTNRFPILRKAMCRVLFSIDWTSWAIRVFKPFKSLISVLFRYTYIYHRNKSKSDKSDDRGVHEIGSRLPVHQSLNLFIQSRLNKWADALSCFFQ